MKIYKATMDDLPDLVQLRIDFLKMDYGQLSEEDEVTIRNQSKGYFIKHLFMDDFIAIIVKVGEEIAGAAFLLIQERPANPSFITGLTGTLLNVITYPKFRRNGVATLVVRAIIDEARLMNVSSIDLSSTEDGRMLYEKLGFTVPPYTPMRLKL